MTVDCETPGDQRPGEEYWDDAFDIGTAARWLFAGENGLARLTGPSIMSAPDPQRFLARMVRVQLDHVALEDLQAGPHRSERGPAQIASHPTPLLTLMLLVEGGMRVRVGEAEFALRAGEFVVLDSRTPTTYEAIGEVRLLRTVVGLEHLPQLLHRGGGASLPAPLPRTPLVDSFFAFAQTVLRSAASGRQARGDHLVRAIAELQSAVLAEAQEVVLDPAVPAALRFRIECYIEAHLDDPDLHPESIAQALGISARHAHGVFNDGERTIARFIRDRRVAAVAEELRTRPEQMQLVHLAHRHGFSGTDTLARAFRQRFGMSPTEYRDGGHRTFG